MLQVIKNNDELQLHQDFKISEKVAFYSKDYDSKDFKLKKIGNIVKLCFRWKKRFRSFIFV